MNENRTEMSKVLRYFQGEGNSPDIDHSIRHAVNSDAVLQAFADFVAEYDDADFSDPVHVSRRFSVPRLAVMQFPNAHNSAAVAPFADAGSRFEAKLSLEGGQPDFPVFFIPESEKRSGQAQVWWLEGDWPARMRPICLVIGKFDFCKGRRSYKNERFSLANCVEPSSPFPLAQGAAGLAREALSAAAASTWIKTAVAKTSVERQRARRFEDFAIEQNGDSLTITSVCGPEQTRDVVIVELQYTQEDGTLRRLLQSVTLTLEQSKMNLSGSVRMFSRPTDARGNLGTLIVRPVEVSDLNILTGEQASLLLADESFVGIPCLETEPGKYRLDVQPQDLQDISQRPPNSWLVRYELEEAGD